MHRLGQEFTFYIVMVRHKSDTPWKAKEYHLVLWADRADLFLMRYLMFSMMILKLFWVHSVPQKDKEGLFF